MNIPIFGDFADSRNVATVAAVAEEVVAPLAGVGATWWDERQLQTSDDLYQLTPVLRRIGQGPPALD